MDNGVKNSDRWKEVQLNVVMRNNTQKNKNKDLNEANLEERQ